MNGIGLIENVGGDIDEVTGMRVTIAAFPIRYWMGDGSLARVVAIVDEDVAWRLSGHRRKTLVVGAGTMGHGSGAGVRFHGGCDVRLVDVNASILEEALGQIRSNLETMAEAKVLASAQIDPILERIETTTDLEASAGDVDLAIEAVPEDAEIKRALFVRLDEACPADTILLSNTSSLNLFEIVRIRHPERFCIAHWYAPPLHRSARRRGQGPQDVRRHGRTASLDF